MAAKYHIGDDGMPGVCKAASNDSCPKVQAGDAFHGTLEEASSESARRFEEKLGAFVTASRKEESRTDRLKRLGKAIDDSKTAEEREKANSEFTKVAFEEPVETYTHPQGKFVKVYEDGSVRAFDKDGREAKTSATAEKLRAGYGSWKRATEPKVSKAEESQLVSQMEAVNKTVGETKAAMLKLHEDKVAYNKAHGAEEGRAFYYGDNGRTVGENPDPRGSTHYIDRPEDTERWDELNEKRKGALKAQEETQTLLEKKGLGHRLPDEGNTIRVRTQAQKWLLENELKGQISDGTWENSANNPWEDWSGAHVIVDPKNAGRNFDTTRDSYNLTRPDLLDSVGDRMIEDVQARTGNSNYGEKAMRADLSDLKKVFKTKREWVDGN